MTTKRTSPYQHADGSGCWTKNCSRNNSSAELNPNPQETSLNHLMTLSYIAYDHVPRNLDAAHSDYYAATDKKHFGDKTEPGSKFLNPELEKVENVLMLRMEQTGQANLDGDDRTALLARGSDPNGFMADKRYLLVLTEGTIGIKNSQELPSETKVEVTRTKPGSPCSLVMEVEVQPSTDYAVIVLGEHQQTGKDFLITTFPGPVTKPTISESLDAREGQVLTIAEVKEILGGDFWINTKIR